MTDQISAAMLRIREIAALGYLDAALQRELLEAESVLREAIRSWLPQCLACNDTGIIRRPLGLVESCGQCRIAAMAWRAYERGRR